MMRSLMNTKDDIVLTILRLVLGAVFSVYVFMPKKRVLAYSTISQLGYMFAAVGVGAYAVAIFHLVCHAFFKALLFLGAGSVIHGLGGEQDMRKMGGLAPRMMTTTVTFLVGIVFLTVAASLDALKEYGFHWATRSGTTVAISDVVTSAPRRWRATW